MSTEYKTCEYTDCSNRFKAKLSGKNRPKKFCSMDCYNLSRSVTVVCSNPHCAVLFSCAKHENRKYCSLSCSATVNNNSKNYWNSRKDKSKSYICSVCSNRMDTRRRMCDDCTLLVKENATRAKIKAWIDGDSDIATYSSGELAKWARNHLMDEAGHKCTRCGWCEVNIHVGRVVLTIDHVDGIWTNNSYSNLKVLCWNCHSLTPTFGSQNYGNSPKPRPSLHQTPRVRREESEEPLVGTNTSPSGDSRKRTKIDWPEIDDLIIMVEGSNYFALSKELGVSDNAIRKRVRSEGYNPKTLERM